MNRVQRRRRLVDQLRDDELFQCWRDRTRRASRVYYDCDDTCATVGENIAFASFSNGAGGLECLDGQSLALTYDSGAEWWAGSSLLSAIGCTNTNCNLIVRVFCVGCACKEWFLDIRFTRGAPPVDCWRIGGPATVSPEAGFTYSPFNMVFETAGFFANVGDAGCLSACSDIPGSPSPGTTVTITE